MLSVAIQVGKDAEFVRDSLCREIRKESAQGNTASILFTLRTFPYVVGTYLGNLDAYVHAGGYTNVL